MGLETSKHADATYQPKGEYALSEDLSKYQPKGSYALQSELNNYQPKGSYLTSPSRDEYILRGSADKTYQPKGNYLTNVFTPFPKGNGGYITTNNTYDVNIAGKSGLTKGNAIVSLEDQGTIAIQSLDGTGKGSQLVLSNNGIIALQDLSRKGNISLVNGEVYLSSTDKFCFNKTCFTPQDIQTLYNNLPQEVGKPTPVAPSKYLRTRNYMHY